MPVVSVTVVLVLLACSLGYAGLDLLRKILVRELSPLFLLWSLTVGMVPFFAGWVGLEGVSPIQPGYLVPAVASIGLNIVANLAFFEAVRDSPLSVTIPLLSFTPVFATLLAIPLLGELPDLGQAGGIVMVVLGAFLLHVERDAGARRVMRALYRERGSLLMLVVAASWSLASPFDKLAIQRAGAPLHGLVLSLGIVAGLSPFMTGRLRRDEFVRARSKWMPLAAALLVGTLALAFQLLALRLTWVSLVETFKRGVGSSAALVTGRVLFGEPVTASKVVAVALMLLGVAMTLEAI